MFDNSQQISVINSTASGYSFKNLTNVVNTDSLWSSQGFLGVGAYSSTSVYPMYQLAFSASGKTDYIRTDINQRFDFVDHGVMSVEDLLSVELENGYHVKMLNLPYSSGFTTMKLDSISQLGSGVVGGFTPDISGSNAAFWINGYASLV